MKGISLYAILLATASNLVSAEQLSIQVSNPDNTPVQGIVLYAEPLDFLAPETTPIKTTVEQKDRAFSPFITVAQSQDEIAFVNQDDFTHHIYSLSGPNRFSFKLQSNESNSITPVLETDQPTAIAMGCNIHDWMNGYILLVDTPYYGITDSNGAVALSIAQPGRYRITLWHPQLEVENQSLEKTIYLSADEKLSWQLPLALNIVLPEVDEEAFDFLNQY